MNNQLPAATPLDRAVYKLLEDRPLTEEDCLLLASVPPRDLLIACTLIKAGEASTVAEALGGYAERLGAHERAMERQSAFRVVGDAARMALSSLRAGPEGNMPSKR